MKVAVTGSSGFVGQHLVNTLKKNKHDVIEIDLKTGYDITLWSSIEEIISFDVMIHLAAKSFVPDSYTHPREFHYTNFNGTLNALELCRKNKSKFIFISSYIYGNPEYLPIDENHPVKIFNPYARTKIIGENLCEGYNNDFGIPIIIFRPFNIYGTGQNSSFLIPQIISQALNNQIILKDKRPKRDFIYIDDVVNALLSSLEYTGSEFEIFNLGSGRSTSVETLSNIIRKKIDNSINIKFLGEHRENEVLDTIACIDKARTLLNWNPQFSLEKGLDKILN